ncbi:hypothetical protein LTR17_014635 [Elasticomyces elasticus]|nr:hypothetical protein LTR17_014635 [Elasticomyces elasticus]
MPTTWSNRSVATITSSGCAASSTFVTISSTTNAYPFTSRYANSAIVAWATTQGLPDGASEMAGASTIIKAGKQLSMELNPSASQNVGTLTGEALYTSISSAISVGCGTIASGATMVTCTVPEITGVGYVEDLNNDLWDDGHLSLSIPFMSVTDNDVLQALISSVAGAFMASSTIANNSKLETVDCGAYYSDSACQYANITNVAALAQGIYTDDVTDGMHSPQSLGIALTFSEATNNEFFWWSLRGVAGLVSGATCCTTGPGTGGAPSDGGVASRRGGYVCEANSLASSAIYYSGILLGALAAIPGFEWAAAAGAFISSVNAGTKAAIKAISLTCEIQTLTGGD